METLSNYQAAYKDFKQALDAEMHRAAESFVRIGFLLNFAEETNIVQEGGYVNVNEFAKAEYNIDATQVSRFVNIYKRFGVDGEPRLKDQYTNHGVAKLGIMLTLPEYINEEITEDYSKSEITAIKREIEAEAQISDIEVMCEEKSTLQQLLPEGLKQVVLQFVKDYPQEYLKIYEAITLDDLKDIMAPNEAATYKVRIPGVGLNLMFLKANENIVVTNTRNGEKNTYEWEDFFNAVKDYFVLGTDAKESWSNIFKEPFPEAAEPENADKYNVGEVKPVPRKESKVKVPVPKKEIQKPAEELQKEQEEQLPGQDSILNHPELLPDDMKEEEQEVLTGEVEDVTIDASHITAGEIDANTDKYNVQQDHEGMKIEHFAPVQESKTEMVQSCKRDLEKMVNELGDYFADEEWDKMSSVGTSIVWKIKTLKKLLEENNGV